MDVLPNPNPICQSLYEKKVKLSKQSIKIKTKPLVARGHEEDGPDRKMIGRISKSIELNPYYPATGYPVQP